MDLTGGGAFYSLTPRRDLEDLGVNELKANPPYPPLGKGANKGSFCKGAGAKRLRIFNQDILRPSAEILSANLMTNAQNDKIKSPLPPLLVCSRLTGLRARLSALTLRPQLASRFTKGGKIPAFTLAEVLVTLGIIGVVAAMTLPMLAKNYQFYVRQQQFKKAYAAMSIAVQKTQIDLGEGVKCYYKNWADTSNRDITECPYFYEELLRNIRVVAKCEGDALEKHCLPKDFPDAAETYAKTQGGDNPQAAKEFFAQSCGSFVYSHLIRNADVYVFNDFIIIPNKGIQKAALLTIDINGHKGPNKWGHDMFLFQFLKQKKYDSVFNLVPSQACHPLDVGGYYTKDFFNYLYGQNAEL